MTPFVVIELNDWELSVYTQGSLAVRMPGFALVEPKLLILGEDAMLEHRRSPLNAHFAYWHRLDASPIRSRNRNVRTSADIVFSQLMQLIDKGTPNTPRVVVAVPSHYSKDQLALLLGITEQTPIEPFALVDSSVALASTHPGDWVLDVSLQQMTLTRIDHASGEAKRVSVESLPEGGLLPLLDAWLTSIADEFVRETRFDPLRIADTEQQLWSRLYDWILGRAQAHGHGLHMEVSHQSGNWHVNFDTRELERLSAKLGQTIATLAHEPTNARLVVSSRAARIPGLIAGIQAAGISQCHTLNADALPESLARQRNVLEDPGQGGVRFVTSLGIDQHIPSQVSSQVSSQASIRQKARPSEPPPTHLVHQGIAKPIAHMIDLAQIAPALSPNTYRAIPTTHAIEVHHLGDVGEQHVLTCGSTVTLKGQDLLAIRVADHGA